MSPIPNPRVLYAAIPEDYPVPGKTLVYEPDAESIDLDTVPLDGGVLVKTLYLSVDPYFRGRMRDPSVKSYMPAFEVGKPGQGGKIVKVLRSESSKYKAGDVLSSFGAWNTYSVLPEAYAGEILDNPQGLPWSVFLGVGGMPGRTAFYSLREYAKFKKGETIFVSTAGGAVGSIVVQLAKLAGLRVIASAGSPDKLAFVKEELGADVVFNYKTESVWDVLEKEGPVDIYFDNVGGEQLDAALKNAAPKGTRIIVCGYASQYNNEEPYGLKNGVKILTNSITINGFIQGDLVAAHGLGPFTSEYLPLLADGKLKYKEDRTVGLEKFPETLVDVLKGDNNGKAVVVVAED